MRNLLSDELIEETFASDYGRTLNLNDLQQRMKALQSSVADQGYSLARVSGPERVSPEGVVTLKLLQGSVSALRSNSSPKRVMTPMRTAIPSVARPRSG
jgi:outer membrane protein insertion porin family